MTDTYNYDACDLGECKTNCEKCLPYQKATLAEARINIKPLEPILTEETTNDDEISMEVLLEAEKCQHNKLMWDCVICEEENANPCCDKDSNYCGCAHLNIGEEETCKTCVRGWCFCDCSFNYNVFLCLDCKVRTDKIDEYYMVTEKVWKKVNPADDGMLCITCLEKRLERQLRTADFDLKAPLNHIHESQSALLRSRVLSDMNPWTIEDFLKNE